MLGQGRHAVDYTLGRKIKFFPKDEKAPADAVRIAPLEECKKGKGLYAPYSEWEADVLSGNRETTGEWIVKGKRSMSGWSFRYSSAKISGIAAPSGDHIDFTYAEGRLKAVVQHGIAFIEVEYEGRLAKSLAVNGVETALGYATRRLAILPKTPDGRPASPEKPVLASVKRAGLDPVEFEYTGNYLSGIRRQDAIEKIKVSEDGRILSDGGCEYFYDGCKILLKDRAGRRASYILDRKSGILETESFSGEKRKIHYFMRYDVAYLGKPRLVEDGAKNMLAGFRYDASTGDMIRIRDRFGNDRNFEYDTAGRLVKICRRASGSRTVEPVLSFSYGKGRKPVSISRLDSHGSCVSSTTYKYDASGRPVSVDNGSVKTEIAYNRFGYPVSIKNSSGGLANIHYDKYNNPVSATDGYGTETRRVLDVSGLVSRVERVERGDVVAFQDIVRDGAGRPVSCNDQNGLEKIFERDGSGRILKETLQDGAAISYSYDDAGRLKDVTDENGNKRTFAWSRSGLDFSTTAEGQTVRHVRDVSGKVSKTVFSWKNDVERVVEYEYDQHGRLARIDYGGGEIETFDYDRWNRLARHSLGKESESYEYDYCGRLARRAGGKSETRFSYDAHGRRTRRTLMDASGRILQDEARRYSKSGNLVSIASSGLSVAFKYDKRGRIEMQDAGGCKIRFYYDRNGRLSKKTMDDAHGKTAATLEYLYSKSGMMAARIVNGRMQRYVYDRRLRLVKVLDGDGTILEKYVYDPAGNILSKTICGETTTYKYDAANQLVSSVSPDGSETGYGYDAAGRMIREGGRSYRYGYFDKVLSMAEGADSYSYTYHPGGQLATVAHGGDIETLHWDGLALAMRGGTEYVNEPHAGGGAPILASGGVSYFNDALGTTLASVADVDVAHHRSTAFGAQIDDVPSPFFTGKPQVPGLGRAFLMRNYSPGLGRWRSADPLGFPDGWNNMAYGNNSPLCGIDFLGCAWDAIDFAIYYYEFWNERHIDTDEIGYTESIFNVIYNNVLPNVVLQINEKVSDAVREAVGDSGTGSTRDWTD